MQWCSPQVLKDIPTINRSVIIVREFLHINLTVMTLLKKKNNSYLFIIIRGYRHCKERKWRMSLTLYRHEMRVKYVNVYYNRPMGHFLMEASTNKEEPSNSDRNGKHVIFLFSKMLPPDIKCLKYYSDRNSIRIYVIMVTLWVVFMTLSISY